MLFSLVFVTLVLVLVWIPSGVYSYRFQMSPSKVARKTSNAVNIRTRLYDTNNDDIVEGVEIADKPETLSTPGPFGLDFKDPQSYITVLLSGLILFNVLDTIYILIKRATSGN